MSELTLLSTEAAETVQDVPSAWELAMQYIIFGVIIVVSIFILILIRKRTRLPRHADLKKRLDSLLEEVRALSAPFENRMQFVKRVSHVLYTVDNLSYISAVMGEKERYSDLSAISSLLGEAHSALAPYKFGKKEAEEGEGLAAAEEKVARAIAVADTILSRDKKIKKGA